MKKKLFLSSVILGLFVFSCKKKDDKPASTTTTPATITVIAKDSMYDGNSSDTQVRIYEYNSSKILVKIKYYYGTPSTYDSYDTIVYNSSGQILKVMNYSVYSTLMLNNTSNYTYNSGNLISIVSSGDTISLVYSSGKISTVYEYSSTRDTLTSIVYTGNNASSGVYDGTPVTINTDLTAENPYYKIPSSNIDFINLINPNNTTLAYATGSPSNKFQDATYTYSSGRVSKIVDNKNVQTTYITYKNL